MEPDIAQFTPQPMCHLLHGLPGAGKSKVLQWIKSYWETVWKYKHGEHFVFVAYSNSMADNINGFTMHSFSLWNGKPQMGPWSTRAAPTIGPPS